MAKNKKRALITGISGQDGSYLTEILLEKGYEVHGTVRRSSTYPLGNERIEHLRSKIQLHYADMTDPFSLLWAIKNSKPHEIYNLAAQSHVQVSWETPLYTAQTVGIGFLNLLESVRVLGLNTKIYQASTSELYDGLSRKKYTEKSRMNPVSPYGSAKLYAYQIGKNYRDAYGMFICNGILFNHESPRRGNNFVTKKIINEAKTGTVKLGNIEARRDWGYAPEYMMAAWLMLQQNTPDDYVIATGKTTSVKEFVALTEKEMGVKLKIIIDKEYIRPLDVPYLVGDSKKARSILGWKNNIDVEKLVKLMVNN